MEVTLTQIKLKNKEVIHVAWKDLSAMKEVESELQESQNRFYEYAKTSFDWAWEVDTQGRYTYVGERVKDFLGYEPEEIIGKTPFDTMSEEEGKRVGEIFISYIKDQKPFNLWPSLKTTKFNQPKTIF